MGKSPTLRRYNSGTVGPKNLRDLSMDSLILSLQDGCDPGWISEKKLKYPRFGTFYVILALFLWFLANISESIRRKSIPSTDLDSLHNFTSK